MDENPFECGSTRAFAPKARATLWLIRSGILSLAIAVTGFIIACVVLAKLSAISTHQQTIVTSQSTPKPFGWDFAIGASFVVIVSLAILGIVLITAGFLVRQPIDPS